MSFWLAVDGSANTNFDVSSYTIKTSAHSLAVITFSVFNRNIDSSMSIPTSNAFSVATMSNDDNTDPVQPVPRPSTTTSSGRAKGGPRGGIYDPFPLKLHRMLDILKAEGLDSVVSWMPHGRALKIHQPKEFASHVMNRFFNQSKYTSFQRQLNLYGKRY